MLAYRHQPSGADMHTLLTRGLPPHPPIKRSVFVSYHHGGDQAFYDAFARTFASLYGMIRDTSIHGIMDSDDVDYMMRHIRENYITGSSCTVVLCGPQTPWRKFVDWEIKATLDKEHGLIGVKLPTLLLAPNSGTNKPVRLQDNVDSGYAVWVTREHLLANVNHLTLAIENAIARSTNLINNWRPLRMKNGADLA